MNFVAVWWELGLLPWAAWAAYVLGTSGRAVHVPALTLWRAVAEHRHHQARRVRRPPAWIVWTVLGVLAGVLAAAGPVVGGGDLPAVVVLDRGVTMVPGDGREPIRSVVDQARAVLRGRPATWVVVPAVAGGVVTVNAGEVSATAVDTSADLAAAVGAAVRSAKGRPVLVLTNQAVAAGPGVVRITPGEAVAGIGIVELSARDRPRPQAMVRVADRASGRTLTARVRVASGGATTTRDVRLIAGRGVAFIDLPTLGPTVTVAVDGGRMVDGRAWLAVEGRRAWVSATVGVASAVSRVAAAYDRTEGARDGVSVSATDRPLSPTEAGVQVTSVDVGGGTAVVTPHPVTADVGRWVGGAATAPDGWTVIVTVDGRPTVAVRDGAVRQVWAAVNVRNWSRTSDWVVFFANVFRWVADGGRPVWTASSPRRLASEWHRVEGDEPPGVEAGFWPGVYRAEDGRLMAIRAAQPTPPMAAAAGPAVSPPSPPTGPAVVVAIGCTLAAAWAGRRRPLSP